MALSYGGWWTVFLDQVGFDHECSASDTDALDCLDPPAWISDWLRVSHSHRKRSQSGILAVRGGTQTG